MGELRTAAFVCSELIGIHFELVLQSQAFFKTSFGNYNLRISGTDRMMKTTILLRTLVLLLFLMAKGAVSKIQTQHRKDLSNHGRRLSQSCSTCADSDGGALCSSLSVVERTSIRNSLVLACPSTLTWAGMDACCQSLLDFDWEIVRSCLCGGLNFLGITGFVDADEIVSACGCAASRIAANEIDGAPVSSTTAASSSSTGTASSSASAGATSTMSDEDVAAVFASANIAAGDISPP